MDVLADPQRWSEQTFAQAQLGHRRRTRRLVAAAAKIAAHPEKSFPQVFDWNELRGFYRLCNQSQATLAAVQQPHWQQTRAARASQRLVLIVHDTTELDFSTHRQLQGVGQIGNEYGRGFLQHNSLALLPQPQQVLGLAYQQLLTRQPASERPERPERPERESSYQRKRRDREAQLWPAGFEACGTPPPGCTWVDVADRGSDAYEALRSSRAVGHEFLVRVAQNRRVFVTAEHQPEARLLDYARSLPSVGQDVVAIPARGGRPGRTASVALASAPVWLPAPAGTAQRRDQPILAAWVVRIWEPDPPDDGTEPLEWIWLCSLPSPTLEELKERRDWYCCRWWIEIYHNIEKNGCREEDRRFQTAQRLQTCLAILAVVAVRIFPLRCALEHQADEPAEQVASPEEIQLLRAWLKHKGPRFTVGDWVRGVAKLGGFLGRRGDGEPGVRALWRGYQRLQDMLEGLHLLASSNSS